MAGDELLGMSDDDFLNMNAPSTSSAEEVSDVSDTENPETQVKDTTVIPGSEESESTEEEEENTSVEETDNEPKKKTDKPLTEEEELAEIEAAKTAKVTEDDPDQSTDDAETDTSKSKASDAKDKLEDKPANATSEKTEKAVPTAEEYKSFYEQVMTPFKANGKTIDIKDPAEAVQLMKMGANYTWKMQSIAPHRKTLLMLENNGLLDEDKLSYLIDLDKKNPEAIKKLVKDAGIDPLDIDTNEEPKYQQGNHKVSEEQVRFSSVLEDFKSTPEGLATLQVINTSWDNASIDVIGSEPTVINAIHEQRQNGIYDRIANEVERQRVLGNVSSSTPFIHAYRDIGNQMANSGAFNDLIQQPAINSGNNQAAQPQQPAQAQGVKRVATPKPSVTNNDKAKAASTSRNSGKKVVPPKINPLAMSDEDFLKQMENRV